MFVMPVAAMAQPSNTRSGRTSVYSHDENGNALSGSKEELLDGLRKGYSLKVGWGWTRTLGDSSVTLEHFAEPIFTTIIQKKHLSIVIQAHPLLKSYLAIDQQEFNHPDDFWQCVLTTEGTFNAQVSKRSTGELVRHWPQRHRMNWYLEYP